MVPAITFNSGHSEGHTENNPEFDALAEGFSKIGLNVLVIDVESSDKTQEEIASEVKEKFYDNRVYNCRFITFLLHYNPYLVIFQRLGRTGEDENPSFHSGSEVWGIIEENVPGATLVDGGSCLVGVDGVKLFSGMRDLQIGTLRTSRNVRQQVGGKLGFAISR